jgi:hypothetical protein
MSDRIEIWKNLAGDWKPYDLEKLCHESMPGNLPSEIEKILEGQQIGRTLVTHVIDGPV